MPLLGRSLQRFLNPLGRWQSLAVALFHLAALALVSRLAHWSFLSVVLGTAICLLPVWVYSLLKHLPFPLFKTLSPLAFLYTVAIVRLAISLVMRVQCTACDPVPQPLSSWLSYEWAALLSLTLGWLVFGLEALPAPAQPRLATLALLSLVIVWAALLLPHLVPSGVTGADPFAYVQMGIDLASRGTPFHAFPLADLARQLNLPIYPTLYVGYNIPGALGASTVWPIGFPVLLAAAYKLFGEAGLYLLNPFLGLLVLVATGLLTHHVFRLSFFWSCLSAALLLTSLEQSIRLSVPLADVAAQLFTLVAITAALWPPKASASLWQAGLCGAACGLAFVARYTQLLIAPGLLLYLLWNTPRPSATGPASRVRQLGPALLTFSLAFGLVALPDFFYRSAAFGTPLSFAAGELGQFSLTDILPVTGQLLADLAADLNLALPFTLLGLVFFIKDNRRPAAGLALALGPVILFHLPYHYLKLRDLLFILPFLYSLAAYGVAQLGLWLQSTKSWRTRFPFPICDSLINSRHSPSSIRHSSFVIPHSQFVILHCSLFIALAFRFSAQLPLLSGYYTYGFLTAQGRAQIDSLAQLTPPQAVIAASLNSGAIGLYAGRATFRPGHLLQPGRNWTEAELLAFASALQQQGRPLYLLADSEEMDEPVQSLRSRWRLTPIAELYLPYYYRDGSARNDLIPLYRLDPQ